MAFLPAAVIGFLAGDFIDSLLENVLVVAITMFLGGILLLFVDKWFNKPIKDQEITYPKALKIGFWQCVAMIPGVSPFSSNYYRGDAAKAESHQRGRVFLFSGSAYYGGRLSL